jgi:DNA-directed RNA polymerase subunit RPC12/RpoP
MGSPSWPPPDIEFACPKCSGMILVPQIGAGHLDFLNNLAESVLAGHGLATAEQLYMECPLCHGKIIITLRQDGEYYFKNLEREYDLSYFGEGSAVDPEGNWLGRVPLVSVKMIVDSAG